MTGAGAIVEALLLATNAPSGFLPSASCPSLSRELRELKEEDREGSEPCLAVALGSGVNLVLDVGKVPPDSLVGRGGAGVSR